MRSRGNTFETDRDPSWPTALSVFQGPHAYEQPLHQLDLAFLQRFRNHWGLSQRIPKERLMSFGLPYEL